MHQHPSVMHPAYILCTSSIDVANIQHTSNSNLQTPIVHLTSIHHASNTEPAYIHQTTCKNPAYIPQTSSMHPSCIQHASSLRPACTLCSSRGGAGCDRVLSPTNPGFNVKCQMSCSPQQALCSSTAPAIMGSIRSPWGFDCHQHPPFRIPSAVFIIFTVHPKTAFVLSGIYE